VIAERSELTSSLPVRGGWEGRAFNSLFACFIIRGAASLLHESWVHSGNGGAKEKFYSMHPL
jgi:hypothetical protein